MADLSNMSVGVLRQRAASAGVAAQQIEDARDGDDPQGALIDLINAVAPPVLISTMSVGDLRQRAASVGVVAQQIEDARDSDDPKGELIALITAAELGSLSVGDLRQRAASAGVSASQIEVARDSDDPKSALIALISGQPSQMKPQSVPFIAAAVTSPSATVPVFNINIAASPNRAGASAQSGAVPVVNITAETVIMSNKPRPLLTTCRIRSVLILGIVYVRSSTT
jgi:hypothetical protein